MIKEKFMSRNWKTIWSSTIVSLFAVTTVLDAADDTQMRNLENRVSALEQRKGSNGMINPPARPVVKDGVDLFIQGDALLWQASETGLEYGIKNSNGTEYVNNGRILKPHFEWDWGFKLAAGYNMMHDGWDLFLQWTRFYTDNDEHGTTAGTNGTIFPSFVNQADPSFVTDPLLNPISTGFQDASAYWKLRLNILDLELGREFYVSKWLTLRPHAGLRSAWIRQKLNASYSNGFTSIGRTVSAAKIVTHNKNNFWGMGLRGGLDGNWGLGSGFSIFSDLAAAILLGHFKVVQYEFDTISSPASTRLNVSEKYRAARVTLDLDMGLRYDHTFANDSYGLMLQIGWEQHMFFSQNQLKKFMGINNGVYNYSGLFESSQDDLNTQGVTFSARFDF
jgi:hypothetical protein